METIRKKICVDDFISRRPGVMPFIKKDNGYCGINYVDAVTSESNYGNFPCDFALVETVSKYDETLDETTFSVHELDRLRYADIIGRYNKILDIVNNGIILRKIKYTENEVLYKDCQNSGNTEIYSHEAYRWTVTKTDDISIFNCLPADASLFITYNGHDYYENLSAINSVIEEVSSNSDDIKSVEVAKLEAALLHSEEFGILHNDGIEYIIILNDYPVYLVQEQWWENWWNNAYRKCSYFNESTMWENVVFDSYYRRPRYFKFLFDVEKYIIGKVRVPEKNGTDIIGGTKTPNCVYYMSYGSIKNWFEEHSSEIEKDKDLKQKWESLGGDEFYGFLVGIDAKFLHSLNVPESDNFTGFTFLPSNVEIPLALVGESNSDSMYKPYEKSIGVDNEEFDSVFTYVPSSKDTKGSALTPTFVTFNEGDIVVESRLNEIISDKIYYLTDKLYGVFNEFDEGGKLFECSFKSNKSSSRKKKEKFYSGTTVEWGKRNGEWEIIRSENIPETFVKEETSEKLPKAGENTYQIVGLKKTGSTVSQPIKLYDTYETIEVEPGVEKTATTYTYYTKETENKYSWWSCKEVANSQYKNHPCGDGENINFSTSQKYRNLLLLSCVPDACEGETGKYYYMVKYDNGYTDLNSNTIVDTGTSIKKFSIPYDLNIKKNIMSYDGEFSGTVIYDELISKEFIDDGGHTKLRLEYVMGATSGESILETGIHYLEKFPYTAKTVENVIVDGIYNAEILCEKIDTENLVDVYSEDYLMYRKARKANIIGMEVGTQWTSASCVNAYLYTEESFDGLFEYPKVSVDIIYDRGNAAAWEKRFKLSECNTMEDIENYGNNYFNI